MKVNWKNTFQGYYQVFKVVKTLTLTHLMPLITNLFSIPPENLWFSDTFRGYRKRSVVWNGLISNACKVSKYGVISGPYFPAFGLNTERYVSLRIKYKCGKIRTRNNSVFGQFSRSAALETFYFFKSKHSVQR